MAELMMIRRHDFLRAATTLVLTGSVLTGTGCGAVGAVAAKLEREGSRDVSAEYKGLSGKSFAIVVAADRTIQGEHPLIIEFLIDRITQRLADPTNTPAAGGYVPPVEVAKYLSQNPGWTAKSMKSLATELGGVDRIIFIDLYEFRLNDPGNAYLWEGRAAANVSVVETDSTLDDFYAFQKTISVGFPDEQGLGPSDIAAGVVRTELSRRMVDRASWLFYDHTERNIIEY